MKTFKESDEFFFPTLEEENELIWNSAIDAAMKICNNSANNQGEYFAKLIESLKIQ